MTKTRVRAELEMVARNFRSYAKAARGAAEESGVRTKKRADWKARAKVWDGAALEVENALAVLMSSR